MPKLQGWAEQGGVLVTQQGPPGVQGPPGLPGSTISAILGTQFVNVKDFGALGNGVRDDTVSIQNAIWSLGANGGTVFVPTGTYLLSAPLFLTQFSAGPQIPVMLTGSGRQSTVLLASAVGYDGIRPSSYSHIAHMTIRGASSTPGTGIAIDGGSVSYLTIEDVVIENWPSICINSGGNSSYWIVNNVVCRNSGDEAILITGTTAAPSNYWQVSNFTAFGLRYNAIDMTGVGHQFNNLEIYQCGGTGVASGLDQDGFLIAADVNTPTTSDIVLNNIRLYQNNTHGLRIQGGNNTTIKRIRVSNLITAGNGTGDGSTNPATRFGDGCAIVVNGTSSVVSDVIINGAVADGNSRYGFNIEADIASGLHTRIQLLGITAINHTGYTGSFGSVGVFIGLITGGTAIVNDITIQGHSFLNQHAFFSNAASEAVFYNLWTDDTAWLMFGNNPGSNIFKLTSNQNTQLTWHSTAAGARDYAWLNDTSGNFSMWDLVAGLPRMTMGPAGALSLSTPANTQINLNTTAGGAAHNYALLVDTSGNFSIYDLTAGAQRFVISSAGNASMPPTATMTAGVLQSDVATGTAPLLITSTTPVLNLNIPSAQIPGTTAGGNAAAGYIGEYLSASLASGSAVPLTTGVISSLISVALTAGDWDLSATIFFAFGATTSYQYLIYGISTSPTAFWVQETQSRQVVPSSTVPTNVTDMGFPLPNVRVNVTGPTTMYLIIQAGFAISTLSAYGFIRARRVR